MLMLCCSHTWSCATNDASTNGKPLSVPNVLLEHPPYSISLQNVGQLRVAREVRGTWRSPLEARGRRRGLGCRGRVCTCPLRGSSGVIRARTPEGRPPGSKPVRSDPAPSRDNRLQWCQTGGRARPAALILLSGKWSASSKSPADININIHHNGVKGVTNHDTYCKSIRCGSDICCHGPVK